MAEGWALRRLEYRDPAVAAEYDRLRSRRLDRRVREWMEAAFISRALGPLAKGSLVLDLPCGTGRSTALLLARGYRVLGLDISEAMLRVARARLAAPSAAPGPGGRLLGLAVAEAERLPLADRAVDAALVVRFLHLVPAEVRARIYAELGRVTRGPILIGTAWSGRSAKRLLRRLRGVPLKPLGPSPAELAAELEAAGLEVLEVRRKLPFLSSFHLALCRARG